jgi:hypothetical protein
MAIGEWRAPALCWAKPRPGKICGPPPRVFQERNARGQEAMRLTELQPTDGMRSRRARRRGNRSRSTDQRATDGRRAAVRRLPE